MVTCQLWVIKYCRRQKVDNSIVITFLKIQPSLHPAHSCESLNFGALPKLYNTFLHFGGFCFMQNTMNRGHNWFNLTSQINSGVLPAEYIPISMVGFNLQ
jgi:hypothetical protein